MNIENPVPVALCLLFLVLLVAGVKFWEKYLDTNHNLTWRLRHSSKCRVCASDKAASQRSEEEYNKAVADMENEQLHMEKELLRMDKDLARSRHQWDEPGTRPAPLPAPQERHLYVVR